MINEEKEEGKLLGTFLYDQDGEPIQTFEVQVRKSVRSYNQEKKATMSKIVSTKYEHVREQYVDIRMGCQNKCTHILRKGMN